VDHYGSNKEKKLAQFTRISTPYFRPSRRIRNLSAAFRTQRNSHHRNKIRQRGESQKQTEKIKKDDEKKRKKEEKRSTPR